MTQPALSRPRTLRQGRHNGRTLYIQQGEHPDDTDVCVGLIDSAELAATIVRAVNAELHAAALLRLPVDHHPEPAP